MLTGRARAEKAIAIMAAGGTIAEAAEATNYRHEYVWKIRAGRVWKDLWRPDVWPSGHKQKLTDEIAASIIARVSAGEDRAHVCLTCGVDITIGTVNNLMGGFTFKHLERPTPMPKVTVPKVPKERVPLVGASNSNSKLTENQVRAIALRLRQGEGTTCKGQKALGREYEVSYMTIRAIASGKTWGHITGIKQNE